MTSTTPANLSGAAADAAQPATIGDVAGAPTADRAARFVARVTGEDSAPVRMRAPFTGLPITTLPQATGAEVPSAFAAATAPRAS